MDLEFVSKKLIVGGVVGMQAAICSVNSKYVHSSPAPWCLLAGVRAFSAVRHEINIVEGTVNEPVGVLMERLCKGSAQVFGFCCYIWNIAVVRRLVKGLRALKPQCAIVLGGPEVSFCAEQTLRELPEADYVLAGEGERPFALLLDALQSGRNLQSIPGLCRRENGTIAFSGIYRPKELPPMPDTQAYAAHLNGRIAYLETSRGCPFSCAFCLSGRCDPVRFFSVDYAKQELLRMANSGAQTVKLIDRTFNCNNDRTKELIRFLIDQRGKGFPENVCFHFEVGADLFDEESLLLLERAPAGLFQIEAGLQSFCPETLRAVSRRTDLLRLKANLSRLIRCRRLHVHIDLIAGLPYEGLERFGQSFDEAYALHADQLQLGFLKLIYGSRLRDQAQEFGFEWNPEPPYEVTATRWLTAGELRLLHDAEDALERLSNSGRFCFTVCYLLKATGMRPFELFCRFGKESAPVSVGISLDAYTEMLWNWAVCQPGVEKEKLRDVLVCDRLASIPGGKLPALLKRRDSRLAACAAAVRDQLGLEQERKGAALLYGYGERLVLADENCRNPINRRFRLVWKDVSGI